MYIKLIGSLFLLGSASAIGFLKAEELNERVKVLQELKRMMSLLLGELRFHRAVLSEAFENAGERTADPLKSFLKNLAEQLEGGRNCDFETVWEQNAKQLLEAEGFCREDEALLDLLKTGLGYLDLTMQTETLNVAMLRTEEAIAEAKEQKKIKGRLYQTMGVTVGALLTLLII